MISKIITAFFICTGISNGGYGQVKSDTLIPFKIYEPENEKDFYEIGFGGINSTLFTKSKKQIELLRNSITQNTPVIVSYNEESDEITKIETKVKSKGKSLVIPLSLPIRGMDEESVAEKKSLTKYIPRDSIDILFKYFQSLTCIQNPCTDENICITFKYKTNGCFARAHWMKKIIEDDKNYFSDKIFSFGRLRANNNSACDKRCVNWGWHVAPVVYSNSNGTTNTFVIDPSIADGPKTVEEWLDLQKVKCKNGGTVTSYEIVSSDHYSYDNGKYVYDTPDYKYAKGYLKSICALCAQKRM